MRLFGILLIVANLLAGGAFVYFATQDRQGRQQITARMLQHLLLVQGLPLEGEELSSDPEGETPFVMEMGGGESTKTISKKLLENYFQTVLAATPAPADAPAPPPGPVVSLTTAAPVVTNQIAEVKRVQTIINGELDKADVAVEAKIQLLKGWLLLQAEDYERRVAYQALLATTDANGAAKTPEKRAEDLAELRKLLAARFDAVINAPVADRAAPAIEVADLNAPADDLKARRKEMDALLVDEAQIEKQIAAAEMAMMPVDDKIREALRLKREALRLKREEILKAQKAIAEVGDKGRGSVAQSGAARVAASGSDADRRIRLAHLLVHLDPDPVWQKRVSVVVGLRRYVKAIADQLPRFKTMLDQVESTIPGDQAVFARHEAQLRELASQNSERARAVAEQKAALAAQKNREDDAVRQQETQLKELTELLNRIKQEVDELLVRQTTIEKQLFEIQREVSLTLEEVYRLEALLAATERERFGLPPRP